MNIALLEQPLSAAVAGGSADMHGFGQVGIGHTSVLLQMLQNTTVDAVELRGHERFFRPMRI